MRICLLRQPPRRNSWRRNLQQLYELRRCFSRAAKLTSSRKPCSGRDSNSLPCCKGRKRKRQWLHSWGDVNRISPRSEPLNLWRVLRRVRCPEQLSTIGRAIGRSLHIEEITPDQARRELLRIMPAPS